MKSTRAYYAPAVLAVLLMMLSCKDPEVERKVDANLQLQIKRLYETDQLDQKILIAFKANEMLTDLHREVLQKKGIQIIANIGQIYTAQLPAKSLYDLARMRFVESIQGSRELRIQPPDSTGKIQQF